MRVVEKDVKLIDVNFTPEVKLETVSVIDVVNCSIIDIPVVAPFVDVINGTLVDGLSIDTEVVDSPAIDILVCFSLVDENVVTWAEVVIIVLFEVDIMTGELTYEVDTVVGLSVVEEDVKLVDVNFTLEVILETVSVIDVVNCSIIDVIFDAEFVDVINRSEVDGFSIDIEVVVVKLDTVSVIDVVDCSIIDVPVVAIFVDVINLCKVDVLSIDTEVVNSLAFDLPVVASFVGEDVFSMAKVDVAIVVAIVFMTWVLIDEYDPDVLVEVCVEEDRPVLVTDDSEIVDVITDEVSFVDWKVEDVLEFVDDKIDKKCVDFISDVLFVAIELVDKTFVGLHISSVVIYVKFSLVECDTLVLLIDVNTKLANKIIISNLVVAGLNFIVIDWANELFEFSSVFSLPIFDVPVASVVNFDAFNRVDRFTEVIIDVSFICFELCDFVIEEVNVVVFDKVDSSCLETLKLVEIMIVGSLVDLFLSTCMEVNKKVELKLVVNDDWLGDIENCYADFVISVFVVWIGETEYSDVPVLDAVYCVEVTFEVLEDSGELLKF